MNLNELIRDVETKLQSHDLTLRTRRREEDILRELEGKRNLLRYVTDEMMEHQRSSND